MSVEPRYQILVEYAKWTARAAVAAGGPIKDTDTVNRLLDGVAFGEVLLGEPEISFDCRHQRETEALCYEADDLKPDVAPFPVGWSTKLINVFLKTAVYAGGLGRDGLRDVLHPPLDNGIKKGLKKHFHGRPDMLEKVDFGAIKDIKDYAHSAGPSPTYRTVIEGCRVAAKELEVLPDRSRAARWPRPSQGSGSPRRAGQRDLPQGPITPRSVNEVEPVFMRIRAGNRLAGRRVFASKVVPNRRPPAGARSRSARGAWPPLEQVPGRLRSSVRRRSPSFRARIFRGPTCYCPRREHGNRRETTAAPPDSRRAAADAPVPSRDRR